MTAERSALVTSMRAVPNIGVVHAYERTGADLATLKQHYYSATHQQIRGWFVRRVRIRETGILQPLYLEVVEWQIRGFMAVDDAGESELVFDDLLEGLRDRLRDDSTLGGTVMKLGLLDAKSDRGLQLEDFGPYMFGGVLCHGAKFSLVTAKERRQIAATTTLVND